MRKFPSPTSVLSGTVALTVSLALLAASCGDPPELALEVTTGHESGVLTEDPAIAEIKIVAKSVDGEVRREAKAAPGGSFDLGEVPDTAIMTFTLTGTSSDGTVMARGRSVSIPIGSIDADVLSLFIQRQDRFARPPGELVRTHVHAPGGILAERFLVMTGGDSAIGADGPADPKTGDYYDMLGLAGSESSSNLPITAKSLVSRADSLLLIGENRAIRAQLTSNQTEEKSAPDGLTFADVEGGLALDMPNGTTLVVGATRPDGPTNAILAIDPDGVFSALTLAQPRAGAAASYIDGIGIVVVGGSADGAGVEVIGDDLSVTTRPFPADATTGAAAFTFGEERLALVGGRVAGAPAPTRIFLLSGEGCVVDCMPELVPTSDVPALAARGRGFALESGALVIGESDAGETLAFHVSVADSTIVPLPLREPRFGATPIPAPNGTLAIAGGVTDTGLPVRSVETYFPQ
ncbi:MAG: hypothetical protein HOV80_13895 [Polyangiaceae bacterium]|nr:hypothetical protein [Polyangiaceae bacterium]